MNGSKKIVIIADPNGAGETTFAAEFLPGEAGCPGFINVDPIAAGRSPFAPETVAIRAGRLMLDEIRRAPHSIETLQVSVDGQLPIRYPRIQGRSRERSRQDGP